MRVAVTGASGNVGTAVLRALLAAGHEVVGIARRPPGPESRYAAADWHRIDLADPEAGPALGRAFDGADAVVHLAWGFQPTHDVAYLEELAVGGSRRVLAAAAVMRVPHVVHQSSLGVYSPGPPEDRPVDESWPREGIVSSPYSRHKATVERHLDDVERHHDILVTRLRPSLIGQRAAASGVLRYTLPALVPARLLRHVPILPVDGRLRLQLVHADDVAAAVRLAVEQRVGGAFNLAADGVITVADLARALGARHVQVPLSLLRRAIDLSWRAHLQAVDVGWLDMGYGVPLLDSTRARVELGWTPTRSAAAILAETLEGLRDAAFDDTPILRERTVRDGMLEAWHGRPVGMRHEP